MMIGFPGTRSCQAPGCDEWLTGKQRAFCSNACRQAAYRADRATTPATPAERTCRLCGATFPVRRGNQTYCDLERDPDRNGCEALQAKMLRDRAEASEKHWDAECAHCGENTGWDGVGRPRRFCSPRCRTAFYRAQRRSVISEDSEEGA